MAGILLAIGAIMLVFFWLRPRKRTRAVSPKNHGLIKTPQDGAYTTANQFHAVSVVIEGTGCQYVKSLENKRFLSKDAPRLPLKNCEMTGCNCHYSHHQDRRDINNDRRIDYGMTHDLFGAFGEENRRVKRRGRRAADR